MPADKTVGNTSGQPNDYTVAADDDGTGDAVQLVKLVLSADSQRTAITADGNGLEVQLGASLPAGTNNIGDVDVLTLPSIPAGTNNIGDVDVLSVIPGTGATNLGKAEDAAHGAGDTGVMALAVRRDANTSLVGTTNDYAPLQVDALGYLKVTAISQSTLVVGGVAATDAAVSGNPVYVGGRSSDVVPAAVTADSEVVPVWLTREGAQIVGTEKSSTAGAKSNVSVAAASTTVLASNTSRKAFSIFNDGAATVYLDLTGGTASATSFSVRMDPYSHFFAPGDLKLLPTVAITHIGSSATGTLRCTEWS